MEQDGETDGEGPEGIGDAVFRDIQNETALAMETVRQDMTALEKSLTFLRDEYLAYPSEIWSEAREALKTVFAMGAEEVRTLNRVLALMGGQLSAFKQYPVERLDGVMTEGLRELIESSTRRSGETTALAEAISSIAAVLRERRLAGAAAPGAAEFQAMFQPALDKAVEKWHAIAERRDPMTMDWANHMLKSK